MQNIVEAPAIARVTVREASSGPERRNAGAASAAALSLVAAMLLFNSVASAVRLFVDHIVAYLGRHGLANWQDASPAEKFAGRGVLPGRGANTAIPTTSSSMSCRCWGSSPASRTSWQYWS